MVAIAAGLFFVIVPVKRAERSQLSGLIVKHTTVQGLRGRKAKISVSVPASSSTFAVVKHAAKTDPDQTGLYESEWYVTSSAPPEAGVLVDFLPDAATARRVLADSVKLLSKPPSLQGESGSTPVAFDIPSVPGVRAVYSKLTAEGQAAGYTYTVDFAYGRAVVSELIVNGLKTVSTTAPAADTRAEYALLQKKEPGLSLVTTHLPVVATIVYLIVALVLAAAAYFLPEWLVAALARRRQRREVRELERSRSQYKARGRRAVRRHRAPAWRQPTRR